MANLKIHPEIANLFPRMSAEEREGVKRSIRKNNVLMDVITWTDAKDRQWIIDGANRFEIVGELKKEGITTTDAGDEIRINYWEFKGTEREALDYAMKMNADRRHLTSSQKAAIAVSHAILERKYELREKGTKKRSSDDIEGETGGFAAKLAEQSGTNRAYIYDCLKFAEEAPEVLEMIRRGECNIPEGRNQLERKKAGLGPTVSLDGGPEKVKASNPSKASKNATKNEVSEAPASGKASKKNTEQSEGISEEPEPKEVVKDTTGTPVPDHLEEVFLSCPQFRQKARELKAIRDDLISMAATPAGTWIQANDVKTDLNNIIRAVKDAEPHAVCPTCKGVKKANCAVCKKGGVSQHFLDRLQWKLFAKNSGQPTQDDEDD